MQECRTPGTRLPATHPTLACPSTRHGTDASIYALSGPDPRLDRCRVTSTPTPHAPALPPGVGTAAFTSTRDRALYSRSDPNGRRHSPWPPRVPTVPTDARARGHARPEHAARTGREPIARHGAASSPSDAAGAHPARMPRPDRRARRSPHRPSQPRGRDAWRSNAAATVESVMAHGRTTRHGSPPVRTGPRVLTKHRPTSRGQVSRRREHVRPARARDARAYVPRETGADPNAPDAR